MLEGMISDEESYARDMAKRRGVGNKVTMTRGKYKGEIGTVVAAWPWADYWYDVEFIDKVVRRYHWNSMKEIAL